MNYRITFTKEFTDPQKQRTVLLEGDWDPDKVTDHFKDNRYWPDFTSRWIGSERATVWESEDALRRGEPPVALVEAVLP